MTANLNESLIPNADGPDEPLQDHSIELQGISIHFRDLESRLIKYIDNADAIFGCVAWLTNHKILDALADKTPNVSIVVQKEDFLKPDINTHDHWKTDLYLKYQRIQCGISRHEFPKPISDMSVCSDPMFNGIRCVGNCNKNRNPSFPRMHNKFLVFAEVVLGDTEKNHGYNLHIEPKSVWTGSLNFSVSSTRSFENAIFINNKIIAKAYFDEFCQILALSEPLDWETEWMQPEWRIGS